MDSHRVWRLTLALGWLVALVLFGGTPGQAFAEAEFAFDAPLEETLLKGRPSPFYEPESPVAPPREGHVQRTPIQTKANPSLLQSPSTTARELPQNAEMLTPTKANQREKTPLPASEFPEETGTSSAARGRSGFGPSVAWAVGILAVGWMAKRLLNSTGAASRGAPSSLELLSRQSIGPQQQLTLVRLGQRILLVGTTPNGISTLATVDDPVEVQAIVAELRPMPSQVGPTVLDLLRGRQSAPARPSAVDSLSLSTSNRVTDAQRRTSPPVNREVADV